MLKINELQMPGAKVPLKIICTTVIFRDGWEKQEAGVWRQEVEARDRFKNLHYKIWFQKDHEFLLASFLQPPASCYHCA
jgi:hypothetical protein